MAIGVWTPSQNPGATDFIEPDDAVDAVLLPEANIGGDDLEEGGTVEANRIPTDEHPRATKLRRL